MIKRIIPFVFVAVLFAQCKKDGEVAPMQKDNAGFLLYEDHFLDALWKVDPDRATMTGYHKYDSLLIVPNPQSREKLVAFSKVQADSLARYDTKTLTEGSRIDYQMMQNELDRIQFEVTQLKEYEWNPSYYNVISVFAYILNEKYEPLDHRLRSFYFKLENVPNYYKQAEKEIKNPVTELTDLAVNQMTGGVDVIEKDFADSLKKTKIAGAEQEKMLARAKIAAESIRGFTTWLKNLKNDHPRSFRLGRDLYDQKFKYDIQSNLGAQQMYNAAMERKKSVHREMAKLSRQLWPKYFGKTPMPADSLQMIARVIDTLSAKHVEPEQFQSAIEKQIPVLTAFVRSKDLLTMDPSKPLIVRKEPAYMAGVAGASVSAPGPYDKTGNTYFNVGSLGGWPKEKAESYLREYNDYTLQILCIHEAIPGHYTQLVYANKSSSLIKSILGNGAMIEGWAVYTEQMMLDAGYGNNSPEMWLMWYKWHLRSVCNTILDYSVHCNGMSKDDAIKLLTHEAFQQEAEAEGKWKRVSVTSVQLTSYYTGYKEIVDLREAYKKKMGDKYKLKDFNEKFLSYGSAPVKLIREGMIGK